MSSECSFVFIASYFSPVRLLSLSTLIWLCFGGSANYVLSSCIYFVTSAPDRQKLCQSRKRATYLSPNLKSAQAKKGRGETGRGEKKLENQFGDNFPRCWLFLSLGEINLLLLLSLCLSVWLSFSLLQIYFQLFKAINLPHHCIYSLAIVLPVYI